MQGVISTTQLLGIIWEINVDYQRRFLAIYKHKLTTRDFCQNRYLP